MERMDTPWLVLDRSVVYDASPWVRLEKERVRLPDGRIIQDYHRLSIPDFVVAVTETNDHNFVVIRQYKHGLGRASLTFPGGQVEASEDPLDAVRRELLEETGYVASEWRALGTYTVNGNLGGGQGHFYSAKKAKQIQAPCSGDLEEMEIKLVSKENLINALGNGEIALLNHAAALSMALVS